MVGFYMVEYMVKLRIESKFIFIHYITLQWSCTWMEITLITKNVKEIVAFYYILFGFYTSLFKELCGSPVKETGGKLMGEKRVK